ncbi:mycothiol transferase [Aeromicrobium stalagmiti]|uniref:mycothiol transferase n=1 Tax=Aeromicrobium stalagmiti TaxID=2738988 RepID=UPI003464AC0D
MTLPLPEPTGPVTDPAARVVDYLDFFRAEVRRKATGLPADRLAGAAVPSGWTITELVEHLVHMERRWLVWGFLGEDVPAPHGDRDADGRWVTSRRLDEVLDALDAGGRRTREIVTRHDPHDVASPHGRFAGDEALPTLLGILFHVLQEYARHAGHLDIVRELADGLTGEDEVTTEG